MFRRRYVLSIVAAEIQNSNATYFRRKIHLFGFCSYPVGSPSQLIWIIGVLLYWLMNLEIFWIIWITFFFSLFTLLYNQTVHLPTPYVFIFKLPTLPPSHFKHKDERAHHFSFRSCKFSLSQDCNKYKCNAFHYRPCVFFLKGSKMSFFDFL
jgi:hypothetical protein